MEQWNWRCVCESLLGRRVATNSQDFWATLRSGRAYVTNSDIQPPLDHVEGGNYQFVKCDVRQWKEQVEVFKAALANSPHKSVDIVISNAGISGEDPLYTLGMSFLLLLYLSWIEHCKTNYNER